MSFFFFVFFALFLFLFFFVFLTIQSQAAFVNCLHIASFTIVHSKTEIKFPLLLLLQVIPVKVNYNYFTLYNNEASSLSLKII